MIASSQLPRLGPLRVREDAPGRTLARRIALALAIILAVAVILWIDRDGLRDNAHPEHTPGFIDVLYFTVVSLTTVGYGDITPVHPVARSLAVLEALTGQLYPAILLARLVSLEVQTRGNG